MPPPAAPPAPAPAAPAAPVIPEVSTPPPAAPAATPPATDHFTAHEPGPAMRAVRSALRKKAGVADEAKAPPPSAEAPAAEAGRPPGPEASPAQAPPEGLEPEPSSLPADADVRDKNGKVQPWKLAKYWKTRHQELEGQLAESKKNAIGEAEVKAIREQSEAIQKRNEELENEIRFHNFAKSKEFEDKYQKPYEQAWRRAMADLSELTVRTEDGQDRPLAPQDLLELVNMPLGQARATANEIFGDFADDVMAHRKEIKRLSDEQNAVLEEARKASGDRVKQMAEASKQLQTHIAAVWNQVNEEITKDGKFGQFFKPREGDAEWNKRLAKGFELADAAFAQNPLAPGLKPEERAAIVRRHAAVRNRCASWGALRGENESLRQQLDALKKELEQYKSSTPAGGSPRSEAPPPAGTAWDQVRNALRSKAK